MREGTAQGEGRLLVGGPGAQTVVAPQSATHLMLVKQERGDRVERRVGELFRVEGALAPVALSRLLVERQVQVLFGLGLERIPPFAAAPCRQHGVVNGRGANLIVARESYRVEGGVVDDFRRGVEFERA